MDRVEERRVGGGFGRKEQSSTILDSRLDAPVDAVEIRSRQALAGSCTEILGYHDTWMGPM